MAELIKIDNMREGYIDIVETVMELGRVGVAPRGLRTYELSATTIVLKNPGDALPVGVGRKLNLAIAAVEAVQVVGAFSDPALMLRVSERFRPFMDGSRFWGAYGNRIGNQMLHVVHKLKDDPLSRQAVAMLWDPVSDNIPGKHDYPCTLSLTFQIRDGLEMYTTMRSCDVWLGLAYDVFVFTQLQMTLARILGIDVGTYTHHVVSLHLYESDVDAAADLHEPQDDVPGRGFHPLGFGADTRLLPDPFGAFMRARAIGKGDHISHATQSEEWYIAQLAPYVEVAR